MDFCKRKLFCQRKLCSDLQVYDSSVNIKFISIKLQSKLLLKKKKKSFTQIGVCSRMRMLSGVLCLGSNSCLAFKCTQVSSKTG